MENDDMDPISWEEREKELEWRIYEARVQEMSKFIDKNDASVLDLGAGQMFLQKLLPETITYYPVDFVPRFEQTVVCDFNKKEFPGLTAEVVFLSGILEYIDDTEWFLERAAQAAMNKVVISYSCLEGFPDIAYRRSRGWHSDLKTDEIIASLHRKGFMLSYRNERSAIQPIFCFIKAVPEHLFKNYFCCGCGACANICPTDALRLEPDEDGFFRPQFDEGKCIQCEKCTDICPTLHPYYHNKPEPPCYAFWANDDTRLQCSSGGVFPLLTDEILKKGGVVCGVAWDEDFGVKHILIDSMNDYNRLSHSKYLQSQVGLIYREIQSKLESGVPVLFSGCPCQVAGLNAFLNKEYKHLYTVDLLCHSSPSPLHFKKYLDDNFGIDKLSRYDFRVKDTGWSADTHSVVFKDGTMQIRHWSDDRFQQAFHPRLIINNACENCRFCGFPRQGNISIGDFHGISGHDASLDDTKGTSVILVNNNKGKELLTMIETKAKLCREVPLNWVMNNRVSDQFFAHPARDRFYALSKHMSFNKAVDYAYETRYDVGIVGIWSVENYGSNMTYYALYQTIRDMGLEPLMIERPMDSTWKPNTSPVGFKYNPYRSFDLARLYSNKTEMRELNNLCDMFLVGSDQLLNYYLYQHFGKYINLDWVSDRKKKAAYAASFGADCLYGDDETRAEISYFLKKFDCLSIREDSGVDLAQKAFGVDAELVLDPVFICDKRHFDDLAENGRRPQGKYIAAYILDPDDDKKNILTTMSNHLGLKFNIFTDIKYKDDRIGDTWGFPASSYTFNEDWIRNITDSEFVITDSFHAVCFAIIYKKSFIAIANKGRGVTRFTSLLRLMGLEDRLVYNFQQLEESMGHLSEIDYDKVYFTLDKEVKRCKNWLKNALIPPIPKKSKSTYDFLEEKILGINNRISEIDKFNNSVIQRLASVDDFCGSVLQRFNAVDEFNGSVNSRFAEINEFKKGVAQSIVMTNDFSSRLEHHLNMLEATHDNIEQKVYKLEQELRYVQSSRSYIIGRCITYIPRKLLSLLKKIFMTS